MRETVADPFDVLLVGASTSYQIGEVTGFVFALVLVAYVVRRALTRGFGVRRNPRRDLAIAVVALVIGGAYLVSAANGGVFGSGSSTSSSGAWSSQAGVEVKAGFLDGCTGGVTSRQAICECAFARVTAEPAYSTPQGFASLAPTFQRFKETKQVSALPPGLVAGIRSCAHGGI